jgi:hypothetical protein
MTATNQANLPVCPMGVPTCNTLGGPSTFTFMSCLNAVASTSNPNTAIPPAMNCPNATASHLNLASHISHNCVVSLPAVSTAIANAAWQEAAILDNDDSQEFFSRKHKQTSQPGPHKISSCTPNTCNVLCKGKEDYAFKILIENAYPTAQEHIVSTQASHDIALQMAPDPDAATIATGVQWSPSKVRLYGDMGWV